MLNFVTFLKFILDRKISEIYGIADNKYTQNIHSLTFLQTNLFVPSKTKLDLNYTGLVVKHQARFGDIVNSILALGVKAIWVIFMLL